MSEAKRRLGLLKALTEKGAGAGAGAAGKGSKAAGAKGAPKWAYLLPSEWMFSHDVLSEELRLSSALGRGLLSNTSPFNLSCSCHRVESVPFITET